MLEALFMVFLLDSKGTKEIVDALLSHAADPTALANGRTVLELAAKRAVTDPVVRHSSLFDPRRVERFQGQVNNLH